MSRKQHPPRSNVFHIRSLEEALVIYGRERLAGRLNPIFTVDRSRFEHFAEAAKRSYTIQVPTPHGHALVRGALLHFEPIEPAEPNGS